MKQSYGRSRTLAAISVAYLICAIIIGGTIAYQQMNQAHFGGSDLAPVWLASCCIAAALGAAAAIFLVQPARTGGDDSRITLVATIFGAAIFVILGIGLANSGGTAAGDPAPLPRTGANV